MKRQQVARLRAALRAAGLLDEIVGPPGSNERRLIARPSARSRRTRQGARGGRELTSTPVDVYAS